MVRDGMTQPYTRLSRFHEFIMFKVAFIESIETCWGQYLVDPYRFKYIIKLNY